MLNSKELFATYGNLIHIQGENYLFIIKNQIYKVNFKNDRVIMFEMMPHQFEQLYSTSQIENKLEELFRGTFSRLINKEVDTQVQKRLDEERINLQRNMESVIKEEVKKRLHEEKGRMIPDYRAPSPFVPLNPIQRPQGVVKIDPELRKEVNDSLFSGSPLLPFGTSDVQEDYNYILEIVPGNYICSLCQVQIGGRKNVEAHLQGESHRKVKELQKKWFNQSI